ncbi:MAG: MFS transporter [Candidatus Rokubacteria bacterium]|nr:MFS transporter [Candidatus Rokubacteria bacterium]
MPGDEARALRLRWLVMLVPAAAYFFSYFHRVAPAVVAADVMRAFAITAASLATLSAIYPYVFVAMALVAGSLVDTLGPRVTLALGVTAMGLGTIVFGAAPVFGVACAGRLLVGLGASVILISFLGLAAEWFRPREFAMLSGVSQTVGNVGGLVATAPLALLVEAVGWRRSFELIGGLTVLLGAAAFALVRDRPEDSGLPPVNPARPRAGSLREVVAGMPAIVGNARTWPPVLAAAGIFASLVSLQGLWGVSYLAAAYGMPRVRAAGMIAMLSVGIVVGAPLVGALSDRWLGRRRAPFLALTALYAACWIPLALPAAQLPAGLLGPFFFLMGVASCGFVLVWACVREVNDPARVGVVVGFCNMPIFFGFALLQWMTGLLLDAHWTGTSARGVRLYPPAAYQAAFLACGLVALGALAGAALVTETRCRNVWRPAERAGPP